MAIQLHHALVPSKDVEASVEWFSRIMGLAREGASVRLNKTQVLEFVPREQYSGMGGERHFCFRVSDQEFDEILARVRGEGIKVRSDPGGPGDREVNDEINYYHNGRGFYFSSPDGHGFECITQPYVRGAMGPHGMYPV
jgi:catechol 2,3-dioxygenase-like lactoylglutathione lyase family enzyme